MTHDELIRAALAEHPHIERSTATLRPVGHIVRRLLRSQGASGA